MQQLSMVQKSLPWEQVSEGEETSVDTESIDRKHTTNIDATMMMMTLKEVRPTMLEA